MELYVDCPRVTEYLDGIGLVQIIVSYECLHDIHMQQALMDTDRTGPISDEEMKEWQDMDALLEGFNRHDVIKKYDVQLFRDDDFTPYEPYSDWNQEPNYEFKK